MRYFVRDGYYVPKNNLYGPRANLGVVLNEAEWLRVNDHLHRDQRVLAVAEEKAAAEEEKKMTSWKMASTWKNTLASIEVNREKNRQENKELLEEKKLAEYKAVLVSRAEKRLALVEEAKRLIESQKDTTKTLVNSIKLAAVLKERQNQIAFDKMLQAKQDKKETLYVDKMKKDVQEFMTMQCDEKMGQLQKKLKYKVDLDKQIREKQALTKELDAERLAKEKEDLVRMAIEIKRINDQERTDRAKEKVRLRNAAGEAWKVTEKLNKKRMVTMEQEDVINQIYRDVSDEIAKRRKTQEVEEIQKALACRQKQTEKIAALLMGTAKLEGEAVAFAQAEKEALEREMKERKVKEEKKEKLLAELVVAEKEAKVKELAEKLKQKEIVKWEIIQRHKREQVNKAWRESLKMDECEKKRQFRATLDQQVKEKEELEAKEREEERKLRVSYEAEDKALLKSCDWAINYCKEKALPTYPVMKAIQSVKEKNFLCETKDVKFLKSNVPIDSVAIHSKKDQQQGPSCCLAQL